MAYLLTCDNAACGAAIDSGEGQPALMAVRHLYCQRCAGVVAAVERKVREMASEKARTGMAEIEAYRAELLSKMLPPQLGGTGEGTTEWPQVG